VRSRCPPQSAICTVFHIKCQSERDDVLSTAPSVRPSRELFFSGGFNLLRLGKLWPPKVWPALGIFWGTTAKPASSRSCSGSFSKEGGGILPVRRSSGSIQGSWLAIHLPSVCSAVVFAVSPPPRRSTFHVPLSRTWQNHHYDCNCRSACLTPVGRTGRSQMSGVFTKSPSLPPPSVQSPSPRRRFLEVERRP